MYPGERRIPVRISWFWQPMRGICDEMIDCLKSFIAGIPYDIQLKNELYYESIIYTIFKMCGMDAYLQRRGTNIGRIDAVLDTDRAPVHL